MTKYSKNITFLNMDAIRMGHNYYDELGRFSAHYERNFAKILKANDFSRLLASTQGPGKGNVCAKRVIFMPRPVMLYTWDGWWQDMRCSFIGASSLFQRFNLQVRQLYQLLENSNSDNNQGEVVRVLLIKRRINPGGATQGSRVYKNGEDIEKAISSIPHVKLIAVDLVDFSFEEQVKLISSVQIMIGIHGAGMSFSTHMPIGTKNCCGVIEIFPRGEFQAIKGTQCNPYYLNGDNHSMFVMKVTGIWREGWVIIIFVWIFVMSILALMVR